MRERVILVAGGLLGAHYTLQAVNDWHSPPGTALSPIVVAINLPFRRRGSGARSQGLTRPLGARWDLRWGDAVLPVLRHPRRDYLELIKHGHPGELRVIRRHGVDIGVSDRRAHV